MHFILEPLFARFGKRAIGQLAGATVVGALLPALHFLKKGEFPPGGYVVWTVGGAIAGFTAGLILLSTKRFFGSIFALLGLALLIVPMSRADGLPVGLPAYLIKLSVGAAFLIFGVALLARARRQKR